MIEVFTFPQYSPEWWAARMGIPTISEFSSILAKGEGKTRMKYLLQLAGEIITDEPADNFVTAHMERGRLMEAEAREHYMWHADDVQPVGFIKRKLQSGPVGGSPDALVGKDGLLEIKTKLPHLQLAVLLADKLPAEHVAQVQGGLWLTGRKWCDFVSYWPNLPIFIKRVYPDPDYHTMLEEALTLFNLELGAIILKIPRAKIRSERRPPQIPLTYTALE